MSDQFSSLSPDPDLELGWVSKNKMDKSEKTKPPKKKILEGCRFKIRFDKTTKKHDYITLFINKDEVGSLRLKQVETGALIEVLRTGCKRHRYLYEVDISPLEENRKKT